MEMQVVAVYDEKAKAYLPPFFQPNDAMAVRIFTDCVNDENGHPFSIHPEDYTLYKIGTFDDATGTIEPVNPSPLAHGPSVLGVSNGSATQEQPVKQIGDESSVQ